MLVDVSMRFFGVWIVTIMYAVVGVFLIFATYMLEKN